MRHEEMHGNAMPQREVTPRRARRHRLVGPIALLALWLSSCSPPPAPAGFTLTVSIESVNPVAIDQLIVMLTPRPEMGVMPGFVADAGTVAYAEGVVVTVVNESLQIVVPGDYVRTHRVEGTTPFISRLDLQMWTTDTRMRTAPQVRGSVVHAGTVIADGTAYLPAWPVPLGGTAQLRVPCLSTQTAMCLP